MLSKLGVWWQMSFHSLYGSDALSCHSQLVLRLRWPATMGCNFRHMSLTSSENINIFFVKGGWAWAFIEHCDRVEYT